MSDHPIDSWFNEYDTLAARQGAILRSMAQSLAAQPAPPPRETKSVGFNFKMTPTRHAALKRVAAQQGLSLQKLLDSIVWDALLEIVEPRQADSD